MSENSNGRWKPGRSYHMAVDIDAPAKNWLHWTRGDDGEPVTFVQFERKRAEYKARGYEVFPPCDNIDERGRCAGHEPNAPGTMLHSTDEVTGS